MSEFQVGDRVRIKCPGELEGMGVIAQPGTAPGCWVVKRDGNLHVTQYWHAYLERLPSEAPAAAPRFKVGDAVRVTYGEAAWARLRGKVGKVVTASAPPRPSATASRWRR